MNGRWLAGAALALASVATGPAARAADEAAARPRLVVAGTSEVRSIAVCGSDAWIASRGGIDRYDTGTWRGAHFGVEQGLDTLDVHVVRCAAPAGSIAAVTATGACTLERFGGDARFVCHPAAPLPAEPARSEMFQGSPVTARAEVQGGVLVGTATKGAFFVRDAADPHPLPLGTGEPGPAGFVRAVVPFRGRLVVATFADGLYSADARPEAIGSVSKLEAPFRMVNELAVAGGALWVAANEGLFWTRDGTRFDRVRGVDARGVTGVSCRDGRTLWVTTTSALWRVRVGPRGRTVVDASWWRPAGSRSLQGVAADEGGLWLASEDRGVIRFDGRSFTAHDRLAGLPTSWVVALASDGRGGVFAATLRDGVLRVGPDGSWSTLRGAPSDWTLSVAHAGGLTCIGTQGGAACKSDGESAFTPIAGLPDQRVHALAVLAGDLLVATEAGLALVPLASFQPSASE